MSERVTALNRVEEPVFPRAVAFRVLTRSRDTTGLAAYGEAATPTGGVANSFVPRSVKLHASALHKQIFSAR